MRYYPNLIQSVVKALQSIFMEGAHAGTVVEQMLKSDSRWGSRDRRFIAESIYEIIRWYRLLYEISGGKPESEKDWWRLFGMLQIIQQKSLPPWEEFKDLEADKILERFALLKEKRSIAASIPEWLDEQGGAELGEELWTKILHALNENAPLILRANTLKTNVNDLLAELKKEEVQARSIGEEALVLEKRRKLGTLKSFRQGLFEVQDYGSQQIAPFLEVQPGMKVVDACAGAGGKTLHLAALMENKGEIIALDVQREKLKELKKRTTRNGVSIIHSHLISKEIIEGLYDSADRLLLDVPCTGTGVLKRKPDAKWKLSAKKLEEVRKTQGEILDRYSGMVKTGGKMVYATCSILPSENEEQVRHFLTRHPGKFELKKEQTIHPGDHTDGFYMALLERI